MAVNDGGFKGWPFINHAMELRGTQTPTGPERQTIVYPRRKFTYLVEFRINPLALQAEHMQTNVLQYLKNGRFYASLRSIEHPKVTFKTETLRSYNKYVKVKTATEFQPVTMTFHDDNSSLVMALWKEYMSFYSHAGDIGRGTIANPQSSQSNEFRSGNALTGEEIRSSMDLHPSVGMTLRPNSKRHFFDEIVIYDLGADPDSVNVYYFVNPVVTGMSQDGLDYFDRSGFVGVTWNLEYENYYYNVGVNSSGIREVIESVLGFAPDAPAFRVDGHAQMNAPSLSDRVSIPVDDVSKGPSATLFDNPVDIPPNISTASIQSEQLLPLPGDSSLIRTEFPNNVSDAVTLRNRLEDLVNNPSNNTPDFIRAQAEMNLTLLDDHIQNLRNQSITEQNATTQEASERTKLILGGT